MDIQRTRSAAPAPPLQPYAAAPSPSTAGPADQVSLDGRGEEPDLLRPLRLLHVNDVHGAVLPDEGIGGLARMATVLDRERAEAPEGTLTLNAGDLAEGSMVSYLTMGRVVSESMGQMGFDVVEPGNHDFAWGQPALQDMLADLNAPIVGANISHADGSTWASPYLVREVNGVKVGLIGVDRADMDRFVTAEKLEGLKFEAAVDAVKRYLPEVREQSDLVIVLSHLGFDDDKKLAQAVPGIDVIVGGHSHTELPEGHRENGTLIVQAGTKGRFVGEVDLDYDLQSRRVVSSQARLIPVDEQVPADPTVQAIIDRAMGEVAEVGSRVVGEALEDLHCSHQAAAKINQIHADSVLQATGAEIALCSARNPRGNLQAGPITYEKLFAAFPMTEEDAVVMRVPGSLLLAEMEERIADGGRGPATPAGFRYSYDPSRPSGQRLTEVVMADGSPMDPDREYTVASTISMARKKAFREAKDVRNAGSSQEMFMDFFEAGSPWRDNPDERVKRL